MLGGMLVYIAIRVRGGLRAAAVLAVISRRPDSPWVLKIFGFEISLTVIAALLTLVVTR